MPYPIDILSATWGPADVTETVVSLYMGSSDPSNVFNFTPTIGVLGDPWVGNSKSFTLVYRTRVPDASQNLVFSEALMVSCRESQSISINIGDTLPGVQPSVAANSLYIFNATYSTLDVTTIVRGLVSSNNTLSFTPNEGIFGDPWVGTAKSFSMTYGYVDRYLGIAPVTVAVKQYTAVNIVPPPKPLTILGADCHTTDVKDELTQLINQTDQTLTFKPNRFGFGGGACVIILYQYGDDPMQLLIQNAENGNNVTIAPNTQQAGTQFLNPLPQKAGITNIISATWGNMTNSPTGASMSWYSNIADNLSVTPSNAFFGFDPWSGQEKTAVVFFRYGLSGKIHRSSFVQGTNPCPLEDRARIADPLPARGVLTATAGSSNFYLMGANNKYIRYDASKNSLYADQLDNTSATSFTVVAGSHQLSFQDANVTRYVSLDTNSALTTVTNGTTAAEFNYELVQSGTTATLSLNLTPAGSTNQSIPLLMSIATTFGSLYNNGQLTVVTAYQSTSQLEYSFQVEWIQNTQRDKSVQELALQGIDVVDPCTWAWFTLLKDLTYDFLTTVANLPLARIDSTNRIIQWYSSLQAAGKKIVDAQMAAKRAAWNLATTSAQTLALSASLIGDLYAAGLLWDLIKFIIGDTWWKVTKFIALVCVQIAQYLWPGTQFTQVIQYTIGITAFVVQLGIDFAAAVKACTPGTTLIQQQRLNKTHNMIIKAIKQKGSPFADMTLEKLMHVIFLFYLHNGDGLFGDQQKVPIHMQAPLETLQQQVGMLMFTA